MGLLSFLFGRRPSPMAGISSPKAAAKVSAPMGREEQTAEDAWCDLSIVGESHYQDALGAICGGYTRDGHQRHTRAQLVPEPSNPHDPNAVRVNIGGQVVGYLKREHAARYVKRMAEDGRLSEVLEVRAYITGGWRTNQHDKGNFGVRLETPWPLKRRAVRKVASGE